MLLERSTRLRDSRALDQNGCSMLSQQECRSRKYHLHELLDLPLHPDARYKGGPRGVCVGMKQVQLHCRMVGEYGPNRNA